jgi:phosphoribosylaminoimidazole carboxylase (NCAIR synthetase)
MWALLCRQHGVPMGEFKAASDAHTVAEAGAMFGYPIMLKARRNAFDGRGNAVIRNAEGTAVSHAHTHRERERCVYVWEVSERDRCTCACMDRTDIPPPMQTIHA